MKATRKSLFLPGTGITAFQAFLAGVCVVDSDRKLLETAATGIDPATSGHGAGGFGEPIAGGQ